MFTASPPRRLVARTYPSLTAERTARRSSVVAVGRSAARQVVHSLTTDRLRGEVLLHPRADLRAGAIRTTTAGTEATAAADEVMDLALPHVLLELCERRRGIGAVEATDRHHRFRTRELQRCCVVRTDCRGHPCVMRRVLLQRLREGRRGCAAVEQS